MVDSVLADDIADAALEPARSRYRQWRSALEQAGFGEVLQLDSDPDPIWGVRLAPTEVESLAYSGWISSRVREWQRTAAGDAKVGILVGDDFTSLQQFSVARASSPPCFVAHGPDARAAIEAVCAAKRSFDPAAFDSDGYLR